MDDLVGIGDDAHAEKNLLCEFNDCEKRYSTEHSRRQHYRRHHKDEWEQLQSIRKAEKRVSLTPGILEGIDSFDGYASNSSNHFAALLADINNRPPPLGGTMTEPAGFGLEQYVALSPTPVSPHEQHFPAFGAAPSHRSPLTNRARWPYATPAHHLATTHKRHSVGSIFQQPHPAVSPMLSPALSPTLQHSTRSSVGENGGLSSLQHLQLLDMQRCAISPQPQPSVSMFGNNPFTRSRSFNDLFTTAALLNELSTDFSRTRSANLEPSLPSPLAADLPPSASYGQLSLTAMSMSSAPSMNQPAGYNVAQAQVFNATFDNLFASDTPMMAPPLSPASSFTGLSLGSVSPAAQAPPLSPVHSLPAMGQRPHSPMMAMGETPRLMSQLSTPSNHYQPPPGYEPRRAPSLTVSGTDAHERPITSISQEIAALLAEADNRFPYPNAQ